MWAETTRSRRMPVDVARRPDGNVKLVFQRVYEDPLAVVLGPRQLEQARAEHAAAVEQGLTDEPELLLYTSHFATCPQAAKHRRKTKAA
jgi:hypothetical protein